MSARGDDDNEMPRSHPDDAAIEALFRGQPVDEELAPLALFAEELRSAMSGPVPVPSPQLAALLAHGLSTHKSNPLVTAASNATGPATQGPASPTWRRVKMIIAGFPGGLSLTSKAALGLTMAAGSVTAAGAAGALPAPAQNRVSTAVEAVTPFSLPDKANRNANFGATVSTDARDGGVDGAVVSDAAKAKAKAKASASGRGQTGLDRANETPAAGKAPAVIPSGKPATAGAQGSAGLSTAASTPAAGHVPTAPGQPAAAGSNTSASGEASVSGGGAQGSVGLDTASSTPAAGQVPGAVPPNRPGGRP